MTEDEERAYEEGRRRSLLNILQWAMSELGAPRAGDSGSGLIEAARLLAERYEAIARLRTVCEDFGDNDWPDDLHLADIIEKHLEPHLNEALEEPPFSE